MGMTSYLLLHYLKSKFKVKFTNAIVLIKHKLYTLQVFDFIALRASIEMSNLRRLLFSLKDLLFIYLILKPFSINFLKTTNLHTALYR